MVDVTRSCSNFLREFLEVNSKLRVALLGTLCNQVDLTFDDLLVLVGVLLADVIAADLEHGDIDALRNSLKQDLFFLLVQFDIISDLQLGPGLVLRSLLDPSNDFFWAQVGFFDEIREGPNVLIKWLNCSLHLLLDSFELAPKPDVFVDQIPLLALLVDRLLGLFEGNIRGLDVLHRLALEESSEQDLFKLRNLL